jgi:hypothetical protein
LRLSDRLSSSVSPPQMPCSWRCISAYLRHGELTGQEAQICFARRTSPPDTAVAEIGKNNSGSAFRHAAALHQVSRSMTVTLNLAVNRMPDLWLPSGQASNRWTCDRARTISHWPASECCRMAEECSMVGWLLVGDEL